MIRLTWVIFAVQNALLALPNSQDFSDDPDPVFGISHLDLDGVQSLFKIGSPYFIDSNLDLVFGIIVRRGRVRVIS